MRSKYISVVTFILTLTFIAIPLWGVMPQIMFSIIHGVQILIGLIVLIIFIFSKRYTKFTILIFLYQLFLIITTIINSGNVWGALNSTGIVIIVYIFSEYAIRNDKYIFYKTIYCYFHITIFINFLLLLAFPEGIGVTDVGYRVNFLGIDNSLAGLMYPALLIGYILRKEKKIHMFGFVFLFIEVVITQFFVFSATSLIGQFVLVLFFVLEKYGFYIKYITLKIIVIIYLILFFGINYIQLYDTLINFITSTLGKSSNMSARTYVWSKCQLLFNENIWLGYGKYNADLLDVGYFTAANTHSFLYEILITGGLIGGLLIFLIFKELNKFLIRDIESVEYFSVLCYFTIVFVMGIAESTNLLIFNYIFFAIGICKKTEYEKL